MVAKRVRQETPGDRELQSAYAEYRECIEAAQDCDYYDNLGWKRTRAAKARKERRSHELQCYWLSRIWKPS